MGIDTQTIAWVAIAVGFVGIAWAIFRPMGRHPGSNPISTHWDLVYVDDEGGMQFTMVRVLKIDPATRRMVAWCSRSGRERVFKLSKIVKATDVHSGARINIARLIDKPRVLSQRPTQDASTDRLPGHSSGGWRTSRLSLH